MARNESVWSKELRYPAAMANELSPAREMCRYADGRKRENEADAIPNLEKPEGYVRWVLL